MSIIQPANYEKLIDGWPLREMIRAVSVLHVPFKSTVTAKNKGNKFINKQVC